MPSDILFYSKTDKYFEFSNFYMRPFTLYGKRWLSVEHCFQAQKTFDEGLQEAIRHCRYPWEAKRMGRSVKLREDWEEVKDRIMGTILYTKFEQNEDLRELLLSTGDANLHEDSPTDYYWGRRGVDRLGKILMEVRYVLKNQYKFKGAGSIDVGKQGEGEAEDSGFYFE
jgi:ribA/ribD-fused uncharacterized protein